MGLNSTPSHPSVAPADPSSTQPCLPWGSEEAEAAPAPQELVPLPGGSPSAARVLRCCSCAAGRVAMRPHCLIHVFPWAENRHYQLYF